MVELGHSVKFAMRNSWNSFIKVKNLEFIPVEIESDIQTYENPNELIIQWIEYFKDILHLPLMEQYNRKDHGPTFQNKFTEVFIKFDQEFKKTIETIQPDIILVDSIYHMLSVIQCGIPWVNIWTPNPSPFYGTALPPLGMGLPSNGDYSELYKKFFELVKNVSNFKVLINYYQKHGLEIKNNMTVVSDWLNVYQYPKILDYSPEIPRINKPFYRISSFIKESQETFVIPENLRKRNKPLIYFSFGSMASCYIEFMKKTLKILNSTSYSFIVSKGPRHEQIDLYENMWGEKYVNQLAILPLVDLVIHHGGCNTTIECLYFGKPAIVVPIFYDQLNNAQRIEEKRLGIRVDGLRIDEKEYKCQLLNAIETLLNDQDLKEKLHEVSKEIKLEAESNTVYRLIEKLGFEKKPIYLDE